jgi:hypothetical protein
MEGVLASQAIEVVPPRSAADESMRRLLRIHGEAPRRDDGSAHRLFSASIFLSGLRCLLSYVIFPVVLPAVGIAAAIGPAIGIPVGVLALVFDVRGMRRFFVVEHRWRWWIAAVYLAVMILVISLIAIDVAHALH